MCILRKFCVEIAWMLLFMTSLAKKHPIGVIRAVRRQRACRAATIMVKIFKKKVKLQDQGHEVKNYGTMWKVLSQGINMCNMKALTLLVRKLWPMLKFFKRRSTSRSQGQKLWYPVKGLVTRNTHVQYESPISSGKKFMAKLKFFQK